MAMAQMIIARKLEDLSNEIFLEIFDYFDANDLFFSFASLNSRISAILKLARLHVNIPLTYGRHQVNFLSNHLKCHSDQVISLQVYDEIADQKNIITYLFSRHDFHNLHSCIFHSMESSSKLEIVLKKLSKLTKIVLFRLDQPGYIKNDQLSAFDAHQFSQLILIDTPETLRSTTLFSHYHHPQIATTSMIRTTLTHLQIVFYGTLNDVSIFSLIPLLRIHTALRSLHVTITSTEVMNSTSINVPSIPSINEDDLPKLSSLKSLDLQVTMVRCDIQSIDLILRCMPNLHRFIFTLTVDSNISSLIMDLIDGQNWHAVLTNDVPCLNQFDFHISFLTEGEPIDLDNIINSFKCFLNRYHQWNMCITRWKLVPDICNIISFPDEHIRLWTLNYNRWKTRREYDFASPVIGGTFDIRSTNVSMIHEDFRQLYTNQMCFFLTKRSATTTIPRLVSTLPFENVNHLVCLLEYPTFLVLSFLENTMIRLKRLFSLFKRDDDDSEHYLNYLSCLVNFSNIKTLEFIRYSDITRLNVIERVLLACPNVTKLSIDSSLFFSSKVLDNPALTRSFNQVNDLYLMPDGFYFPSKHARTIVRRFPSLTIIKANVYSIDSSLTIVDTFLSGLAQLHSIVIYFGHSSLLDNPFSRHYVIEKRRQSFNLNKNDQEKITAILNEQTLYIRLE